MRSEQFQVCLSAGDDFGRLANGTHAPCCVLTRVAGNPRCCDAGTPLRFRYSFPIPKLLLDGFDKGSQYFVGTVFSCRGRDVGPASPPPLRQRPAAATVRVPYMPSHVIGAGVRYDKPQAIAFASEQLYRLHLLSCGSSLRYFLEHPIITTRQPSVRPARYPSSEAHIFQEHTADMSNIAW